MPDTNTAHYNLVKPDPGGSSGTWDDKLNANFDSIDTDLFAVSEVADGAASAASNAQDTADAALAGSAQMARTVVTVGGSGASLTATVDLSAGGPVFTFAVTNTVASADLLLTFTNRPVGYDRQVFLHISQTLSGLGNQLVPKVASASKQWALPFNDDVTGSGTQELANVSGNAQVVVPLLIVGS